MTQMGHLIIINSLIIIQPVLGYRVIWLLLVDSNSIEL